MTLWLPHLRNKVYSISSTFASVLTLLTVRGDQLRLKGQHLPTGEKTGYMLCRCVAPRTLRPAIAAVRGRGTSRYPIPIWSESEGEDLIEVDSDWTPDEERVASQYDIPAAIAIGKTPNHSSRLLPLSHDVPLANALSP